MTVSIIQSIMTALYQYFWPALLLAALGLIVLNYAEKEDIKCIIREIITKIKAEQKFRSKALFVLFMSFFLMRLLLGRGLNLKPLDDILGGWQFINADGRINTQLIENIIVFVPLTYFSLSCYGNKFLKNGSIHETLYKSILIGFLSSLVIETLQVVLVLGTFQISDICSNSFGALIGGIIYVVFKKYKDVRSGHDKN